MVLVLFPEEFKHHEEQEQLFMEETGAEPPLIRKMKAGQKMTISLRQLREEYEASKASQGKLFEVNSFISTLGEKLAVGQFEKKKTVSSPSLGKKKAPSKKEYEQIQLAFPVEPCGCFTHGVS